MELRDWLWLVLEVGVILAAVITFVWKAVKQPIDYELRDIKTKLTEGLRTQGERLGQLESTGAVRDKSLEELRRMDQQHSFEIAAIQREQGRFEGVIEKLERLVESQQKSNNDVQVMLATLKTEMTIFGELRDLISIVLENREKK